LDEDFDEKKFVNDDLPYLPSTMPSFW